MRRTLHRAGLVLVELAAAVVVLAVLTALLIVTAKEGRRQSSLGENLANLKQFASATGAYGADNDDRVWGFSWQPGVDYGFGGVASTHTQAAANQAFFIIRSRFHNPDVVPAQVNLAGWLPHLIYSHLPLLDYLDAPLPGRFAIGPGDRNRLLWASDPMNYLNIDLNRRPGAFDASDRRWAFSSSYELVPAFWSPDAGTTVFQTSGSTHYQFSVQSAPLGNRRLTEVAHPAQKVMLHETHQRHFGPREPFFAYGEARVPIMFADGAAAVRVTQDANPGFQPNQPLAPSVPRTNYFPAAWETPTLMGLSSQLVGTRYRFTRSGLRGRDFGGPEVPWQD